MANDLAAIRRIKDPVERAVAARAYETEVGQACFEVEQAALLEALETMSVRKLGALLGMSGQAVHFRINQTYGSRGRPRSSVAAAKKAPARASAAKKAPVKKTAATRAAAKKAPAKKTAAAKKTTRRA